MSNKAVTPAVCRSRDGSGVFKGYCSSSVRQRQPFYHNVVIARLTEERLGSYLDATDQDASAALALYDWNVRVSGSLLKDIACLEVLFRNSVDAALVYYYRRAGRQTEWYQNYALFTNKGREDIMNARARATRGGGSERRGRVSPSSLRLLEVPLLSRLPDIVVGPRALQRAFPHYPRAPDPRAVRADVHDRMKQLHELRNRIAHHDPIHRRDLAGDREALVDIAGWICPDSREWIVANSRTVDILDHSPIPTIGRR